MRTRSASLAGIVGLLLAAPWDEVRAGHVPDVRNRTVRDVVYDYAVTDYCGALTPEVEAGFRRELARLTERAKLTPEQAKAQRIKGWVAADMEWSNRGLGGFRAWCQTKGLDAARHFQFIAPGGA